MRQIDPEVSLEWKNWSRRVRCQPQAIHAPASAADVAHRVRLASRDGLPLRVIGSGHSFSPIVASNGILLTLDEIAGVEAIDTSTNRAWILGGTKLHAIGEPLRAAGLALANQGDIDTQAVAGAIATGTHGTGVTLGNLSSRVDAMRVVLASGEVVEWSEELTPFMNAARVALGLLGVVVALRLQLLPAYDLHECIWWERPEPCLQQLDSLIHRYRHFEFFWYPAGDVCEMKALHPTAANVEWPSISLSRRSDASYRIFPSERTWRFNEMEYAVPLADGPACFRAVAARMRSHHPDVQWPVEYRTLAADAAWMSQAYQRDTATISVHQDARLACDDFFRDMESIFREFHGRPHFGKVHYLSARDLRELYPQWPAFCELRRQLDPQGVFLNDHLRELFA